MEYLRNSCGGLVLFVITVVNWAVSGVRGGNSTYKTALNAVLLDGYNPSVNPGRHYSTQILNINVGFGLKNIQTFDELESVLTVTGIISVSWYDERLIWVPKNYNNLTTTNFKQKEIWTPPFVLSNSYNNIDLIGNSDMPVTVLYTGEVNWFLPLKLSSSCNADVRFYPNDVQTCSLNFMPWGYSGEQIQLVVTSQQVDKNEYEESPTWDLVEASQFAHLSPKLGFKIDAVFKRKPLFCMINFILPTIFVGFINMMVFILPPQSGERVGFSITVLLAFAVFLSTIANVLPQTSTPNMALLCYLLVAHIGQSLLIMLCTIFGLRFYLRPQKDPVPKWMSGLTRLACGCAKPTTCNVYPESESRDGVETDEEASTALSGDVVTWQRVGNAFDNVCCVFFLMTSVIYNTAFWASISS
ncbi:acetylcholine receptor subunit beta-type lev-1-like [Ylistrum balloti]|uniref:acetylcholine receptor subunit beta-type lev-1-like n=1 Tax=Ylistrum balloti TaxID=509963 RepID=UPI002905DC17|nr:acetylcholine receptor subunit beta-type lev-1-like [Ylistrum balloti]